MKGEVDEERAQRHAEMLGGRVSKSFRRLAPGFEREGVGAFRLYDWDIPEIRAVIDWYEGHLVVAEYERRQTEAAGDWLRVVALGAAAALDVPAAFVHLKRRRTRPRSGARYRSLDGISKGPSDLRVRERGLSFRVNLDDYLDTGLFLDQRESRTLLRADASGQSVLNLFGYTGTFSASALSGGAKHVTTVDLSRTYLEWAQLNLRVNGLPLERHEPARAEAFAFLEDARRHGRRWDLVVVDPPSFSTAGGPDGRGFDVERDHVALLEASLAVTARGGSIRFSTHHQRFEPRLRGLEETTERTVPKDYRNRRVHRSFVLRP